MKLHARETAPREAGEHHRREGEVIRLEEEIKEKGTDRDRFILDLYASEITEISSTLPVPVRIRPLSLEEYQQFRTQIERLSDEEIAEEVRKRNDIIEIARKPLHVAGAFTPGVGLGEIIKKQKDK